MHQFMVNFIDHRGPCSLWLSLCRISKCDNYIHASHIYLWDAGGQETRKWLRSIETGFSGPVVAGSFANGGWCYILYTCTFVLIWRTIPRRTSLNVINRYICTEDVRKTGIRLNDLGKIFKESQNGCHFTDTNFKLITRFCFYVSD